MHIYMYVLACWAGGGCAFKAFYPELKTLMDASVASVKILGGEVKKLQAKNRAEEVE